MSRLPQTATSSPFFHAQPHPGPTEEEESQKYRDSLDGVSWVEDDWEDYEDVLNETDASVPQEAGQSSPSLRLFGSFYDHGAVAGYPHVSQIPGAFAPPDSPREPPTVNREAISSMQANKGSVLPESPSSPTNPSFTTAMDVPVTPTHIYHYLTRSDSSATYPPKPRGNVYANQLYNQGYSSSLHHLSPSPSPLRTEFVGQDSDPEDDQDITETYSTARRQLSPIDESDASPSSGSRPTQHIPKDHHDRDDAASVRSFVSSQTLFINRQLNVSRLRSSNSVSSLTSTRSAPLPHNTRTAQNDTSHQSTAYDADVDSPFPPRKPLRSLSHLPIIPASPRVSRNVTEGTGAATMPEPMASLREDDAQLSFNYSDFPMPPSDRNETASLVSQSESMQTELTYLTAQDSIEEEARTPNDNRRQSRLSAALQPGSPQRKSPKATLSARRKASARLLLLKSRILSLPTQKLWRGLKLRVPDLSSVPEKWRNGEPGPAELLFWMGFFLGPWCWLIGALPPRDGTSGVNDPDPGGQQTGGQQTGGLAEVNSHTILPLWRSGRAPAAQEPGLVKKALSSLGFTSSRNTVQTAPQNAPLQPEKTEKKRDPWILRCRIAASISAVLLITLLILAIVVLARSL